MSGGALARIGALVFLGVAVAVTLVQMAREEERPPQDLPAFMEETPPEDPLRAQQRRCQLMGEAARNDVDCLAVWAETRDRFLGRDRPQPVPSAED